MPLTGTAPRTSLAGVCVALAVVSGAVAGCGGSTSTAPDPSPSITQQQCVHAVFDVLRGMVAKPYDGTPFQSFVTRYGTQSVTYDAYLDVFTSFYTLSASTGVQRAETRLLPTVSRDCGPSS